MKGTTLSALLLLTRMTRATHDGHSMISRQRLNEMFSSAEGDEHNQEEGSRVRHAWQGCWGSTSGDKREE